MHIDFAALEALPTTGCVVLLATGEGGLGAKGEQLDRQTSGAVKRAIGLAGDKFKRGSIDLICPAGLGLDRLLIMALDDPAAASALDLEAVGGRLAARLGALGLRAAALVVEPLPGSRTNTAELAVRLAQGAALRAYRFSKYHTRREDEAEEDGAEIAKLTVHLAEPGAATAAWPAASAIAAGVLQGRDLVSEPANVLTPAAFADICREAGGKVGLAVDILDQAALEHLGMRALLGVAQGSHQPPYVAVLQWQGGARGEPPVALIGKGVCFDTGGISIKPAAGMEDMKWDMGGAAAVFGAMLALAGRKAKANVVGVLGLVENMPSGNAQRPGDVVTAMSGTTIEVINTDAEGRLVLADVLHYTRERFKPKAMIDLATLTGAIIVALGHEQAGLFTPNDELAQKLEAAGKAVGERLWRMPLGDDYAKHIKSEIADIKNTGRAREAGATAGAVFLQRFVGDVPWAHLDIAGVAWSKRDLPLAGKGATGFGIRLLDRLIADHYEA